MTEYAIYTITNTLNGKKYVGQSRRIRRRWVEHRYALNANRHHNIKLQRAWNKYGSENFIFEVVSKARTKKEADTLEKECIATFKSCRGGYNITEGGELRNNLGIPCLWNGKHYASLNEACRDNNIGASSTLLAWLEKGYTCDADVPLRVAGSHSTPCIWNGIAYQSLSAAARACGITISNMKKRLDKGYVCDADVPPVGPTRNPCIWDGVKYASISEAAKANDVAKSKMSRLLKKQKREELLTA